MSYYGVCPKEEKKCKDCGKKIEVEEGCYKDDKENYYCASCFQANKDYKLDD